jgi:cytochrome P450
MLGLLLDCTDGEGRPLAPVVIRDQLVTLLFGGHDTSSGALSLMLYELGRNPECRTDVERELDEHLAGGPLVPDHLDGATLPVLERTIDETLRRYPTAWAGPRRTVRPVRIGDVDVPAGVSFNYSAWATHHLAEFYDEPFSFRPDRFLPEQRARLPRGAYIPFGGGGRICVGMKLAKVMLRAVAATALHRLRVDPDLTRPLRVGHMPTLQPAGGMPCRITLRSPSID